MSSNASGRSLLAETLADTLPAAELDEQLEKLASEYMASATTSRAGQPQPTGAAPSLPVGTGAMLDRRPTGGASGSGVQSSGTGGGSSSDAVTRFDPSTAGAGAAGPSVGSRAPPASAAPISWQRGQLLGAGSFGRVFFGLNTVTGELMAIKQINYTPGQNTEVTRQAAQALQREVRLLQSFSHPNIVRYLGVERDDVEGVISIMLEYCAGGSIASLLEKFGAFNEALTRSYLRMVLSGLHFLHTRPGGGVLHRDIKGANVLVDSDGVCKLGARAQPMRAHSEAAQAPPWRRPPLFCPTASSPLTPFLIRAAPCASSLRSRFRSVQAAAAGSSIHSGWGGSLPSWDAVLDGAGSHPPDRPRPARRRLVVGMHHARDADRQAAVVPLLLSDLCPLPYCQQQGAAALAAKPDAPGSELYHADAHPRPRGACGHGRAVRPSLSRSGGRATPWPRRESGE